MAVDDGRCRKKKRGHFCALSESHKEHPSGNNHECFCGEKWEEVKT